MNSLKKYTYLILSIISWLAAIRLFQLGRIAGVGGCTDLGVCPTTIVYSYNIWTLSLSVLLFIFGLAALVFTALDIPRKSTSEAKTDKPQQLPNHP